MLPETWENIRAGGGHIKKGVLDFSLIIMQGRVDAGVPFAFYKRLYSHGPQASFILLSLSDSRKENTDSVGLTAGAMFLSFCL